MKKRFKLLLAIVALLALSMCIYVFNATAEIEVKDDSGKCGGGVSYTFDADTGTLTLSGVGAIRNYTTDLFPMSYPSPWYAYRSSIRTVVIENGITDIGSYAFLECDQLENIIIPDSIVWISSSAFQNCDRLIDIENGVSYVDRWVVGCDSSVTSVSLREDTVGICEGAFEFGKNLTSLTIPDSVNIVCKTFSRYDHLPEEENGVFYVDRWAVDCDPSVTSVSLREDTVGICNSAFVSCRDLVSIAIPSSVRRIGDAAFGGCNSLENITVAEQNPNYVTVNGVLYDFAMTELIKYPVAKATSSFVVPSGVVSIGSCAFYECEALISVSIPNTVTNIRQGAFHTCVNLKDVIFEKDSQLIEIGDCAFVVCNALTNITIPSSVQVLGDRAFSYCHYMETIVFDEDSQLNRMGEGVFLHCMSLTDIYIPKDVESIEKEVFCGCSELTSVTFGENSRLNSIGKTAFTSSKLEHIQIPKTVTKIAMGAFYDCSGFSGAWIHPENPNYKLIDGNLYTMDQTVLMQYIDKDELEFEIPDGVISIGDSAFYNCETLTNIVIPNSVTSIGEYAFSFCSGLVSFTYDGTVDEWNAITKPEYWDQCSGAYAIVCNDAVIPSTNTSISSTSTKPEQTTQAEQTTQGDDDVAAAPGETIPNSQIAQPTQIVTTANVPVLSENEKNVNPTPLAVLICGIMGFIAIMIVIILVNRKKKVKQIEAAKAVEAAEETPVVIQESKNMRK